MSDSKWHMMMVKEITRVSPAWTKKLQESPESSCRQPWGDKTFVVERNISGNQKLSMRGKNHSITVSNNFHEGFGTSEIIFYVWVGLATFCILFRVGRMYTEPYRITSYHLPASCGTFLAYTPMDKNKKTRRSDLRFAALSRGMANKTIHHPYASICDIHI